MKVFFLVLSFLFIFLIISLAQGEQVVRTVANDTAYFKAYDDLLNDVPPPANSLPPGTHSEVSTTEYGFLNLSDDTRDSRSVSDDLEAYMYFNASVGDNTTVTNLTWHWEGYYDADTAGSKDAAFVYVWNKSNSEWYECASNVTDGSSDVTRECAFSGSDVTDYIDIDGYSHFMIFASDTNDAGSESSIIYTDYVKLTISRLNVTLDSPPDSSTGSSSQEFNCSADTGAGDELDNITIHGDFDGTFKANETLTVSGVSAEANFTIPLSDGTYTWNCLAVSGSVEAFASNYTLTVDTIGPNVTINKPTANQNLTGSVEFNITLSESGYCEYSLDSGVNNVTMTNNGNVDFNYTNLSIADGDYTMSAYCNDTNGNNNYTETVSFTMDSTSPSLSLVVPSEGEEFAINESIDLNFTVSDSGVGVDSCWYNIDGGDNITITSCANTTFNTTEASHTLNLYANDSIDNNASDSNSFTISLSAPAITLDFPTNNTYSSTNLNIYLNFTATDSNGIDTCQIWHDFNSSFALNETNTLINSGQQNFTVMNISTDGLYLWNVWCNDTLGQGKFSTNNFTLTIDTTLPYPRIESITTTQGSQTFNFEVNITDTNIGADPNYCWYTVRNSTGDVDSATSENESISCVSSNNVETASAFGDFNLTVYGKDLANNENSTTTSFTLTQLSQTSLGGGGGNTLTFARTIPVIGLDKIDGSKEYSDLQREIIYATFNNFCSEKLRFETFATVDLSERCNIRFEELEIIRVKLDNQGVNTNINDLALFLNNYQRNSLFQGFESQSTITKYNLITSVLGLVNLLTLSPPSVDTPVIVNLPDGGSTEVEYTLTANKPLSTCEVIGNSDLTCIVKNSTIELIYPLNNTQFFSRIFTGSISVTTDAPQSLIEQKRTTITFRVYNLGYKVLNNTVPVLYIVLTVMVIAPVAWFRLRKRRKSELTDLLKLK